jgi:hypothetical protein
LLSLTLMRTMSLLPQLGMAVLHRTTREWGFGGSTKREADGLSGSFGGILGVLAGATLGAGLTLLLSPAARSNVRAVLDSAFPKEPAPNRCVPATEVRPS